MKQYKEDGLKITLNNEKGEVKKIKKDEPTAIINSGSNFKMVKEHKDEKTMLILVILSYAVIKLLAIGVLVMISKIKPEDRVGTKINTYKTAAIVAVVLGVLELMFIGLMILLMIVGASSGAWASV